MGNHQLAIITRLLQVVETMENLDDLFSWLADTVVQRMDVQVVQLWTMQAYVSGQVGCELRTITCQSPSLPQHIVINQPLAHTVEQLLNKQQSVAPQSVENVFSRYYNKLLMRYNLNYWGCHFMSSNVLLPPIKNDSSHGKVATPLTLGATVFLQHPPSSRLLPTLAHILEHGLSIARNHGLLKITVPMKQELELIQSPSTGKHAILREFIPYRTKAVYTTEHALIYGSTIRDKNARRLYLEIDGHKTIGELASITQLNTQEFYAALYLLLTQSFIQIFESGGLHSESLQSLRYLPAPRVK